MHSGVDLVPRRANDLRARAEAAPTWHKLGFRRSVAGRSSGAAESTDQGKPTITNESVAATAKVRWDQDPGYRPPNLGAYLERGGPLTAI